MVEQGGGRRKRRAYNTKITHIVPSIHSLPHELLVHVLGRVASHSLRDLLNAKLSCREWNELGDDNLVYKHASLAKISIFRWKRETPENKRRRSLFLQKCVDAGNLEALYRRGVVDYLQNKERGYALGCLKKAANAGHVASMYAVCIISIYLGGEHKKDGISVLGRMKKSKQSRKEVRQARWKLLDIIKMMWLRNFMGVAPKPVCCTKHRLCKKNGWGPIDSDDEDSGIEWIESGVDLWKDKARSLQFRLRDRLRVAVDHHRRRPKLSDGYFASTVQRWAQRFSDFRQESLPSSSKFYRKRGLSLPL
nr:putative F-box protein At1g67623 [Ipomoea batatas]